VKLTRGVLLPVFRALFESYSESIVCVDFELLIKAYEKAKKVIDKEGMPRFYVRCLVELEDFVNDVSVLRGSLLASRAATFAQQLRASPSFERSAICI